MGIIIEEEMEDKERWFNHYSSNQRILLVGEGDFSFSTSLARHFGSASNIVATSLDSYDTLVGKYKKAKANLEILSMYGAFILHGVDATKMRLHPDLMMQRFDRIIFNFPHAGFHGKEKDLHLIERHKKLVLDFFKNASGMLRANGEIHVTHKTSSPFSRWNIPELAWKNSLGLIDCVDFKIKDYPGYNNKRGGDSRMSTCDEPFHLGKCSTFKFRFFPAIKRVENNIRIRSEISNGYLSETNYQPTPEPVGNAYQLNQSSEIFWTSIDMKNFPGYTGEPLPISIGRGGLNASGRYLGEACVDRSSIYGQYRGGTEMWEYERSVESALGRLDDRSLLYRNAAKVSGFQHYR